MANRAATPDLPNLDLASEPLESQRRHHDGGGFSHHGPVLFRRLGEDQRRSANIAIHELSHYLLHTGSPAATRSGRAAANVVTTPSPWQDV